MHGPKEEHLVGSEIVDFRGSPWRRGSQLQIGRATLQSSQMPDPQLRGSPPVVA